MIAEKYHAKFQIEQYFISQYSAYLTKEFQDKYRKMLTDVTKFFGMLDKDVSNELIVGDGMSAKDIKRSVSEQGLSGMFFFEGMHPMEEMPCYTGIADALIATLKSEGVEDFSIPAKVMSYMASGRPILIAMEGEISEIIERAGCGFASKPNDDDALYRNIKTLYAMSREEREAMGERAFRYQQEHFERNRSVDQMLAVIRGEAL